MPKDEGQHLQSVVPSAKQLGGPGRFAFDARSHLDETSALASAETARALWRSWSPHWDLGKSVLLEKSPPTIVRTRFFGTLFPRARFLVIVRHPLVVAMATRKTWGNASLTELVLHWCIAHERLSADLTRLENDSLVVSYERLARDWDAGRARILDFLQLAPEASIPAFETHHDAGYVPTPDDLAGIPIDAISTRFRHVLDRYGYDLST